MSESENHRTTEVAHLPRIITNASSTREKDLQSVTRGRRKSRIDLKSEMRCCLRERISSNRKRTVDEEWTLTMIGAERFVAAAWSRTIRRRSKWSAARHGTTDDERKRFDSNKLPSRSPSASLFLFCFNSSSSFCNRDCGWWFVLWVHAESAKPGAKRETVLATQWSFEDGKRNRSCGFTDSGIHLLLLQVLGWGFPYLC